MPDKAELITQTIIENRIFTIRGLQVMLDKDLALFYGVKPIRLREQVKRNIKRFPPDFMFQLSENEVETMVSQNAIPSKQNLGGHLPYVFTEQGVAALSSVLTSDRAIEVSVQIMRAFVAMRSFILSNAQLFHRLDGLERKQLVTDEKFKQIFDALQQTDTHPKQGIFYDGQVFDAYKFVADIIRKAQTSILLIDNYVDDTVLTLFSKRRKNVSVIIYTKNISKQLSLDLTKFNEQYEPINIEEFKDAHDRFLMIDEKELYHIGASLKDLGKKWFAFSRMDITFMDKLKLKNK